MRKTSYHFKMACLYLYSVFHIYLFHTSIFRNRNLQRCKSGIAHKSLPTSCCWWPGFKSPAWKVLPPVGVLRQDPLTQPAYLCKSLWIKASAKCINININILLQLWEIEGTEKQSCKHFCSLLLLLKNTRNIQPEKQSVSSTTLKTLQQLTIPAWPHNHN